MPRIWTSGLSPGALNSRGRHLAAPPTSAADSTPQRIARPTTARSEQRHKPESPDPRAHCAQHLDDEVLPRRGRLRVRGPVPRFHLLDYISAHGSMRPRRLRVSLGPHASGSGSGCARYPVWVWDVARGPQLGSQTRRHDRFTPVWSPVRASGIQPYWLRR